MTNSKQLIQQAIQANLTIQNALTAQAAQLEAQLKELRELTEVVDKVVATEEIPADALEGEFQIPGSKRAVGPIPSFELLSPESPFFQDASQRAHYLRWTSVYSLKGREVDVLVDAVKKENMRLEAYRARDNPTAPPIDIVNNIEGINWSIVAEKVSDQSSTQRTPDECRIQWVGNLHPKINHGNWTQEELSKLHDLTANELAAGDKINWTSVAKELGTNRIPIDCMKQATTRPRHHWDTLNDQKLRAAVQMYGTNNWNLVARHVSPYVTTSQCQTRYVRSVDPGIKRGSWSPEEDTRLRKAVAAFGNSWVDVAGVLHGRTNEQCRERWGEFTTNAGGKGIWTAEEDERLLELVKEMGNKWKAISVKLGGGRTGPHCRLRYDRLIRVRSKQAEEATSVTLETDPSQFPSTDIVGPSTAFVQPKPRRGRKSKAAEDGVEENMAEAPQVTLSSEPLQSRESSGIATPSNPRPRPQPRPRLINRSEDRGKEPNIGASLGGNASSGEPIIQVIAGGELSALPLRHERDSVVSALDSVRVTSAAGGQTQPRGQDSCTQSDTSTPPLLGSGTTVLPAYSHELRIIGKEQQAEAQGRWSGGQAEEGPPEMTVGKNSRGHKRKKQVGGEANTGADVQEREEAHLQPQNTGETTGGGGVPDKFQQQESPRRSSRKKRKMRELDVDASMPPPLQEVEELSAPTARKEHEKKLAVRTTTAQGRGRGRSGQGRGGRRRGRGGTVDLGSPVTGEDVKQGTGIQEAIAEVQGGDIIERISVLGDKELPGMNDKEREFNQVHAVDGGRGGRGRRRGRGRGRALRVGNTDPTDAQPLRRSSRTANS